MSTAWPVYRRALAGDQLKARRMIEERLPRSVAQWAARQAPTGPVRLPGSKSYSLEGLTGGPNLALGTYAELERRRSRQRPEELAATMWNPAEFDLLDTQPAEILEDPELMDAFQKLSQAWNTTNDDASLRKLMVKVAKSVALLDLNIPEGSLGSPSSTPSISSRTISSTTCGRQCPQTPGARYRATLHLVWTAKRCSVFVSGHSHSMV